MSGISKPMMEDTFNEFIDIIKKSRQHIEEKLIVD